ncbi:hypothetical protein L5G28_14380 [Gordonia sp. HY285]|uniref:hypothetical protein n=1 Tax=Gordonia liuliyuniae TaxID=2911517 RepID=UPI001F3FFE61|nr:hypothetical protein [Gordonia liuliyuniae]MCF8611334.1 hypothetical protein [Gordonia liuliyuniae]
MRMRVEWVVPIVIGVLAVMGLLFGARVLLSVGTGQPGTIDAAEAESQLDSDDVHIPSGFEFVSGWHGTPAFTGSTGYAVRYDGPRSARVQAEDISHLLTAWETTTCDPKTGEVANFRAHFAAELDVRCTGRTVARISYPRHNADHLRKVTVIDFTDGDRTTLYVQHDAT